MICERRQIALRYVDGVTFTGFDEQVDDDDRGRIDLIWLGSKSETYDQSPNYDTDTTDEQLAAPSMNWTVQGYAVLPNFFNGIYCGDHKAVVGDLCLHRS